MSAFCFWNIRRVVDPVKMEQYRSGVIETVGKFGGIYRVVGGPFERIEGDWTPTFPVLIEFPSMDVARQWYESDDYRELKRLRLEATVGDAVFFQSLPGV